MTYTHTLADAIVSYLNGVEFGVAYAIARKRLVSTNVKDLVGNQVTVVPYGPHRTLDAVGVWKNEIDVRIVIQCKLNGDTDDAKTDAVAQLSEDIASALMGESLLGAECQSAKLTPSYDPKTLDTLDVFDATIFTTWLIFEDTPN